jgi:hypothetical protein
MKEIDAFRFSRRDLFSYKFKQSGCHTQVLMDINSMFLGISKTDKCATNNDSSMFLNWKPQHLMDTNDVLQLNGGYKLFINQLIEEQDIDDQFNRSNFIISIQKINNHDFNLEEVQYNNRFGSKRSHIETGLILIIIIINNIFRFC